MDTHGAYPGAMRAVAAELNVPLLDLHRSSMALVQSLGPEGAKPLYMWVEPGRYVHLPQGLQDNTHFTVPGAQAMARLAAEALRAQQLAPAEWLR